VLVWNGARHDSGLSPELYTRYFVHLLETASRDFFGGPEKPGCVTIVANAKGVGWKHLDFAAMKVAVRCVQRGALCRARPLCRTMRVLRRPLARPPSHLSCPCTPQGPTIEGNYPERQFRTYIVSVGSLVTFGWRVVSSFLDPGTTHKIQLVDSLAAPSPSLRADFTPAQLAVIEEAFTNPPTTAPPRAPTSGASTAESAASADAATTATNGTRQTRSTSSSSSSGSTSTGSTSVGGSLRSGCSSSSPGPTAGSVSVRQGILYKRGRRSALWRLRHCDLLRPADLDAAVEPPDGVGGALPCLSYGPSPEGPRKSLALGGCRVELGRSGAYHTITVLDGGGQETSVLGSRNQDEALAWVSVLRAAATGQAAALYM